jgi:hypothetical protein
MLKTLFLNALADWPTIFFLKFTSVGAFPFRVVIGPVVCLNKNKMKKSKDVGIL